ncbi:LacI family DNA-binding transcriptional regulator [Streptomyces pinistramenti]|uniref:LacI family DNA-binding transcriptional regulator n=1 Tax=Streptomyces pinistramenti TaxID=2884812 RepID=UPI001D068F81|nr:LacI family DNA-binding transcriptional regulator [Streptomyces pinistramenti]MCB5909856.1 LacI family transcriptional regulator [Streptomyces pinistramenti]
MLRNLRTERFHGPQKLSIPPRGTRFPASPHPPSSTAVCSAATAATCRNSRPYPTRGPSSEGTGMTLTRVAQHAGVSVSTVSRYLRGQLNVQPVTAARIDAAVSELGYRAPDPQPADRTPATGTGLVSLVLPDLVNPYFAQLADAFTAAAAARDIPLLLGVSGRHAERAARLNRLLSAARSVEGLIYVGMRRTNEDVDRAIDEGLPVVIIDEELELADGREVDTITVDNYGGAYQATSYLVQLGHRTIAHVAGPQELSTTQERKRGYLDAIRDAGLDPADQLVLHGPYTEQFGASTFPYLHRAGTAPTAVFVGSDIAAVGMLAAAELHGLRIPDDLSVVGCDGIRVGQWLRPKLTTLEQPTAELAAAALDALTARIAGNGTNVRKVLPLQLVVRGSAAAPPERAAG